MRLVDPHVGAIRNFNSTQQHIMAEEKKVDFEMKIEEDGISAAAGGSSSSSVTQNRFEIKKWNAVCMWSWDICADTCAICRNSLNEPSIEYQVRVMAS